MVVVTSQPMEALKQANRARTRMHALKRELKLLGRPQSARRLAVLIDLEDPVVLAMHARDALLAVNGIGDVKADMILVESGVGVRIGMRRLRDVSPRQRLAIVGLLEMLR